MTMQTYGNNPVYVSTVGDNGVIAVGQNTEVTMGTPVYTGKLAFVRNTYPAIYNHAVRNMNTLIEQTTEKKKRSMRGGHFFLYRYMVLFAVILCLAFGIASIFVKPCSTVPFVLSVLHIFLSVYNIVIYRLNHPLIHPFLAIYLPKYQMPDRSKQNMFFTVPIRTDIRTTGIGALIDPARIVAAVQSVNTHVNTLDIMVYTDSYERDARFPKECVFYLILFIIMFILAIIFVSSSVSR